MSIMSKKTIIVTGGAGFIGSCLVAGLNARHEDEIIIVDSLGHCEKWKNLTGKKFIDYIDKNDFIQSLDSFNTKSLRAIFHMGACSKTTEKNADYLMQNNTLYTRKLAEFALKNDIAFYYASSAATYGQGESGYRDDEAELYKFRPNNMYGFSKHAFDLMAYQLKWLDKITGFKFFNVFGPNENHKLNMTSVVFNAYHQIRNSGCMKLFRSDNPEFKDGEQLRDFIYVKDVVKILLWFLDHPEHKGIYNLGRGEAVMWKSITSSVFSALNKETRISYVDMPELLKGKYQYHTLASMEKLFEIYHEPFMSIEESVQDYVVNYLKKGTIW